jgi:hydroxypyruvate isomerase
MTMRRRELLASAGAALLGSTLPKFARPERPSNGRLKQSVCRWPYERIALPEFCGAVADLGLKGIDLLAVEEWGMLREYGLVCSMGWRVGGDIPKGLNDTRNHDAIVNGLIAAFPKAAKASVPNLITFFGNREGRSDPEAVENCVRGLDRVKKEAEEHGVTVCVELLNSKVDHKDYQGDRTAFGVEVVKRVGSPRVKLLYDVYHMQIMEGDIIATIRANHEWIGHFHTGGVPGRHELDDTQELNWRGIAAAIADVGFTGFVAHEFVPTRDPLASLKEAVGRMSV